MPTTTPAAPAPASAPVVVERDSVAGVVRWFGLAVLSSVFAVVVAGAFAADVVAGDGVAVVVVAAVAAIFVPLIVGLLAARGKPRPIARAVRVVFGVQLVALLALVAFAATPTAEALRHHGHWPARVAGGDDVVGSAMAHELADRLSPAPVVEAVEAVAVVAPRPAAGAVPSTPKEVFAARAGSVVVVQVRQTVDKDSPLAAMAGITIAEGHGSGFVVDGGLVVTNHHVIEGATSARIRFNDGRVFDSVHVLVDDAANDLALLAVDGDIGAPAVPFAVGEAGVGDRVVVIGSPLGLDYSLSSGLVSARREQSGTRMLQIDATIAPGSSGGPVFDEHGALIGVSTAMRGAGLGFAVDVAHVVAVLKALRTERVLTKWAPGFELKSLDVEGHAVTPTARANLLSIMPSLVESAEACVVGRPAGELVIAMKGSALDASSLTKKARACLKEMPSMLSVLVTMTLSKEGAMPTKITARYVAADGRVTILVYEPITAAPSR